MKRENYRENIRCHGSRKRNRKRYEGMIHYKNPREI